MCGCQCSFTEAAMKKGAFANNRWMQNHGKWSLVAWNTLWLCLLRKSDDINVSIVTNCMKNCLNYWGQVTHIYVSKLTIIGSDNGLLPGWHQAIIWTNAGLLLIGPLAINFNGILITFIHFCSRKCIRKCRLEMACGYLQNKPILVVLCNL